MFQCMFIIIASSCAIRAKILIDTFAVKINQNKIVIKAGMVTALIYSTYMYVAHALRIRHIVS